MVFLGVYRAVYDYQPQGEEELEIKEGDLLFLLEKSSEDDWWKCKKKAASEDDDEPEGLVPNNYVEAAKPIHQAKALYDYAGQTDEEMSFKDEARLDVYDDSDPDWTLVGSNGEFGFAPAIYIEKAAAASNAPAARALAPAPPPMPARPVAADEPIPGEADYVPPSSPVHNPASQLAGIIAQRTDPAPVPPPVAYEEPTPALPQRPRYVLEEPEEEPEAPSLPQRPVSIPSPPQPQIPIPSREPEPRSQRSSAPLTIRPSAPVRAESEEKVFSPGGYHLYNISEMVEHMGKNRKMPTTLGINIAKGTIMISPEKSRDGPSKEWTAEKLTHYSIEGKHVFMELVRPSKSVDFHAGAKDTAREIVAALGDLAGAVRQEGLKEVIAASAGTGAGGQKKGQMLYEFMAQGEDEVTVAAGDEVIILDDARSEEWWMVKRLKNGKQGVVPSQYVEITGTMSVGPESVTGLNAARSTVEQNRLEEERLTKEASRKSRNLDTPERGSSLNGDTRRTSLRGSEKRSSSQSKSKPNQDKVRTWTDRSGTFKVDAEFIGLREGKIHLHKLNGVKIAVPVAKMSVEDLEYVERATGASLDEDKPLSDIKRRSTLKAKSDKKENGTASGATIEKKPEYDWFDFFLQCGVNPQICERYAAAFSKDQMGPEVLPDVNERLLRTLGLKEGDILRVMKHLDGKYDRKRATPESEGANGSAGGLFSGPGGALMNNRKGRPAPAVQTNDVVDESAFKPRTETSESSDTAKKALATPLASAGRATTNGFDDDAWNVKPTKSQPSAESSGASPSASVAPPQPPKPLINDDIASLAISAPALQPEKTAQPPPAPVQPIQPAVQPPPAVQAPPVANQAIFDKIAALAPAAQAQQPLGMQATGFQTGYGQAPLQPQMTAYPRTRPAPPIQQPSTSVVGIPPPPRSASAPGYPQQPQSTFAAPPLQPQVTGYQPQSNYAQLAPPGQSLQDLQNQQRLQQLQPQQTAFQPAQPYGQVYQQNGIQSMQQNYPALQPQPTGFTPQSQFGQQQAQQLGYMQTGYQQQGLNGQQNGSPFGDPPRPAFQPTPSSLSTTFMPQQTGYQSSYGLSQPTGMNGFGMQQATPPVPQLPPQQTGGVFGPSQSVGPQTPIAPLIPQKTGPPPPVRFGVQPGAKPLIAQPTGRANLAKATPQNPFGF